MKKMINNTRRCFMDKIFCFGSCGTRDSFRIPFPERYSIANIQRNSIMSLFSKQLPLALPMIERLEHNNFEKNMLTHGFMKNVISTIKSTEADYFVMDLGEERLDYISVDNNSTILTYPQNTLGKIFDDIFVNGPYKDLSHEIREFDDRKPEDIEECFSKFCFILKELYAEEKIIIVEILLSNQFLEYSGKLRPFKQISQEMLKRKNLYLKKLYNLLREKLPDAKFIKFPTDTICVDSHMWGGGPGHNHDAFYHYVAECIDNITGLRMTGSLEKLYKKQCLENKIALNMIEMSMMHDMYKQNIAKRYPDGR